MKNNYLRKNSGFTLVENIIAIAIFVLLSSVIYETSSLLIRSTSTYRENAVISNLANQYMEIIHNLPYANIGTLNGNPHGNLPDLASSTEIIINDNSYKVYYTVNYVDDAADGIFPNTDSVGNDYKQVKLYVKNSARDKVYSFVTNITPKGLEGMNNGGSLVIDVIDANGQPVPAATVNITNTNIIPNLNLTRLTDENGRWVEVGLPASANSYHIKVNKNNYSSDQTYPIGLINPNPTKPDSTVIAGQNTQISFSIDKLSHLTFNILNQNCEALGNINFDIKGTKLIGNPNLLKFTESVSSDPAGEIKLDPIEWDSYTPDLMTNTYMVYGSTPAREINVLPDTNSSYLLMLGPKTTNSLLVTIKDSTTNNPIEGVSVRLENNILGFDQTKISGGGIWATISWLGGAGQDNLLQSDKYSWDDGNISNNETPTALRLINYGEGTPYATNGTLISSVFDTGTASTTYGQLNWQPTAQDSETTIKFQIATNDKNTATTTWNFLGPDGTNQSYYTTSGTTIMNAPGRYVRYKLYLNTNNTNKTPTLTAIYINYVPGCFTSGQVIFPELTASASYKITLNADGYSEKILNNVSISGYTNQEISL